MQRALNIHKKLDTAKKPLLSESAEPAAGVGPLAQDMQQAALVRKHMRSARSAPSAQAQLYSAATNEIEEEKLAATSPRHPVEEQQQLSKAEIEETAGARMPSQALPLASKKADSQPADTGAMKDALMRFNASHTSPAATDATETPLLRKAPATGSAAPEM